jgi:hypothetical protein
LRCAFQARSLGIWEMLTQYENNMSPMRSVGPLIAVLSLAVAVSYASPAANAREAYIPFRSLVPNSWTLLPPDSQSYGRRFVSPTGDAWLRSLPFLSVAKPPLMPPLTSSRLRPRNKSPTSVGAVIGLSAPDIEATEYFTGGQC